jgi:hypothetical protein
MLEALLIVPNQPGGRMLILGVGGFVIAVGVVMILAARRLQRA